MSYPRTVQEHIEQNRDTIEREAIAYAHNYGCSIEEARRDIEDVYREGWYDET